MSEDLRDEIRSLARQARYAAQEYARYAVDRKNQPGNGDFERGAAMAYGSMQEKLFELLNKRKEA